MKVLIKKGKRKYHQFVICLFAFYIKRFGAGVRGEFISLKWVKVKTIEVIVISLEVGLFTFHSSKLLALVMLNRFRCQAHF